MEQFDGGGEFSAVSIGPSVVGWVGSDLNEFTDDITVRMDSKTYPVHTREFRWKLLESNGSIEVGNLGFDALRLRKRLVLPVPTGSIDIRRDEMGIIYSDKTVRTIMTVLHNFFVAFSAGAKADLHALSPVEVVRKIANLHVSGYSPDLFGKLAWRGTPLWQLGNDTSVAVRAVRLQSYGTSSPYEGRWDVPSLPVTNAGLGSLCATPFGKLVDWQVRSQYDSYRSAPHNVIHVRADSPEEYELGYNLLSLVKTGTMQKFLPDASDAAFFLSLAGDPLEEWIDGEMTITVADLEDAIL